MSYYVHSYPGSSNQLGGSLGEIEVYTGPARRYRQGGGGISRYLSTALRYFRPLLSSGLNALKDQGIKSASSIINQIGEKDIKSILEEEGKNAIKNLKQKAINKLNRSTQSGKGMPLYLHPLQARKGAKILAVRSKKKSIKRGKITKKKQKGKTYRTGGITTFGKKSRQFGGKKSLKRKQKGGKKKRRPTKKRAKAVNNNQLDIFS